MDNRVVYLDGVAYSIAGGNGRPRPRRCTPTTRPPWRGRSKASLPGARNAMAVGAVNGQIVATGGWAAAGPSPATWVFDPAGDAWTAAADAPVSLSASGQAVVDGKLYVVGGCTTSACTPMSNDVAAYDAGSDTLGAARRLPGSRGLRVLWRDRRQGLLHRRQQRCRWDGGQLRLRPRRRLVGPRPRERTGRHLGGRLHRGQRPARRQRWGPGRCRSPTGRSPTTPQQRPGSTCPTPTPLATAAAWPAASTRSAVRPVVSPRPSTARRCQGSRTAAPAPRTSNG